MFRFVYAWQAGEPYEFSEADGFVGVECQDDPPPGVPRVGCRTFILPMGDVAHRPGEPGAAERTPATAAVIDGGYTTFPPEAGRPAHAFGRSLHGLWKDQHRIKLLVENGGTYGTPHGLWTLMEAAGHPMIGVALDLDVARAAGQAAAVMVPTLNLRIGLVRVRTPHDEVAAYARRLAGIGFDGYVVLDPPAGPDRPPAAGALAAVFRGVFPAKPVKKIVPAKALG